MLPLFGLYCGANVDFDDMFKYWPYGIDALKAKLEVSASNGTLPKVVVPVHLTGNVCNMSEIDQLVTNTDFQF